MHTSSVGFLPEYAPLLSADHFFVYQPREKNEKEKGAGKEVDEPDVKYEISIGRLPSTIVDSVESYVEKVLKYEEDASGILKDPSALVIAAHGFHRAAERFAENEGLKSAEKHLVLAEDDVNGADIQNEVIDTINQGCDVVFFVGHGSWGIWKTGHETKAMDQTDVLTCRQIERLSNEGRYPIIFAATCFSAIFDNPIGYSYDKRHNPTGAGIGVYFVESRLKGGIACIAHVGKTHTSPPNKIAQNIINEMALNGVERLGDAFNNAKNEMPKHQRDIGYGIALIGDPGIYVGKRFEIVPEEEELDVTEKDMKVTTAAPGGVTSATN